MTPSQVLEGTWEELSAHAEEFKGERLRLTVLPKEAQTNGAESDQTKLHAIAARLLSEADNTEREPGKPLTDPYEAAWGKGVEEKHCKMGLKL